MKPASVFGAVLVGAMMSLASWAILDSAQQRVLHELTRTEAEAATLRVERDLALRLSRLALTARKLTKNDAANLAFLEEEAAIFDGLYGGVGNVSILDPDGTRLASLTASATDPPADMLALSARTQEPVILTRDSSPVVDLVVPGIHGDALTGFLVTELEIQDWIETLLFGATSPLSEREFAKQVYVGDVMVFRSPDFDTLGSPSLQSEDVAVFNTTVRSELRVRPNELLGIAQALPEAVAFALFFIGLCALWAFYQWNRAVEAEKAASRAARDLQTINDALQAEVEVRRKAEAEATRAKEASALFLATMSHEVRTPLNAIMGMFELIERAKVTARVTRQAQAGRSAAMRLFSELTNVLDASRLDAGALTFHRMDVPLDDLVTRWTDTLVALCDHSRKPILPVVDRAPDLPQTVWLDGDRTTKIVTNLMDNALKFTTEGSVTLRLTREAEALVIRVIDTGIGVPEERRANLFERFYQVEDGRTRGYDGAGLGLAISREVAEQMESDLVLEESLVTDSKKVQSSGSVFRLTIRGAFPSPLESREDE